LGVSGTPVAAADVELSLDAAVQRALDSTARGRIIRGQAEVAGQQYQAKSINFKVPEVSVNGSLPAFDVDESYRFFGGANTKQLYRTRDLAFNSFIELKQSLITGGTLIGTANLTADDSRYPDTRILAGGNLVYETLRQGFFEFSLEQPLFRPSAAKKLLNDLRDDRDIAVAEQRRREGELRRDVTQAYLGVLRFDLRKGLAHDRLDAARAQAQVDSLKFQDGIFSEEQYLQSTSKRLDMELEQVDTEIDAREQLRQLSVLLDLGAEDVVKPSEPPVPAHFDAAAKQRFLDDWNRSVAVLQADHSHRKAERQAKFSASEHRISGDLQARYAFGRGNVETEFFNENVNDDIDTQGWGLLLRVRLPVWDGGAGRAAVKAARFQAEQARLEYEQQVKNARAEIVSLMNDLDVSYRRLDIVKRQIELAAARLAIAESRYQGGEISQVKFLESRIFHLEQRNRYLEELDRYLTMRIDLEHKFLAL
jgi:outer membrane protein TolC